MGRVPHDAPQLPAATWQREVSRPQAEDTETATAAQLTDEYVVSLLRVLARKEPGDPFTAREREACRNVLRAIKRHWE